MGIRLALWILRRAMRKDPGYAWGWHCNIAMVAQDAAQKVYGYSSNQEMHKEANRLTGQFMRNLFGIDTNKGPMGFEREL